MSAVSLSIGKQLDQLAVCACSAKAATACDEQSRRDVLPASTAMSA